MTCLYCGAHMNHVQTRKSNNTYICPECGTQFLGAWTLPVWLPGTDTLTQNGEYLVKLYSTCYGHTRERVIRELQKQRTQLPIAS